MSNEDIPKPLKRGTNTSQSARAPLTVSNKKVSTGIATLPESISEISQIDPKLLGGIPQSAFLNSWSRFMENELNTSKDEVKSLKAELVTLRNENIQLKIDKVRLKTKENNSLGVNRIANIVNAIGLTIFGFGISILDNEAIKKYSTAMIIMGLVIVAASWFMGFIFNCVTGSKSDIPTEE